MCAVGQRECQWHGAPAEDWGVTPQMRVELHTFTQGHSTEEGSGTQSIIKVCLLYVKANNLHTSYCYGKKFKCIYIYIYLSA